MTLSTQAASLRAAFKRELTRLEATPHLGGPYCATREGVLLAWIADEHAAVIDEVLIERLTRLPDGAGAESVRGALSP